MGDGRMLQRRLLEYLRQKDLEVCTLIPRIDPPLMHPQDGSGLTNWRRTQRTVKTPFHHTITFLFVSVHINKVLSDILVMIICLLEG